MGGTPACRPTLRATATRCRRQARTSASRAAGVRASSTNLPRERKRAAPPTRTATLPATPSVVLPRNKLKLGGAGERKTSVSLAAGRKDDGHESSLGGF